jgi:hypothetical protein
VLVKPLPVRELHPGPLEGPHSGPQGGVEQPRRRGVVGEQRASDDFAWTMELNFFIALRASRGAITEMVKQGSGAIVNVASVNAFFQPNAATIDYGAAKAALVNLTRPCPRSSARTASASTRSRRARSLHHPGRGRRADRVPGLRPGRKHHRRQLPHRRWPDQDNLKTEIHRSNGPLVTPVPA